MALITLSTVNAVSAANSSVIYVNDSDGNDSWDGQYAEWQTGTFSGPKKSIKNATGTVSSGGTVHIADGTYTGVNNTNITIDRNMTIIGQSKENTVINGTNTAWVFELIVFLDQSNINLTVRNLTFASGSDAGYEPAILNGRGTLNVINCIFRDNTGGAISNTGTLNVNNSIFISNSVDSGYGGAIYNYKGDVIISGSTFIGNAVRDSHSYPVNGGYGGAIYNNEGNFTVSGSTFTGNTASIYGGAVSNNGGHFIISGSTFTNNKAASGGAVSNGDKLNTFLFIYGSTFTNNSNGAIYNDGYVSPVFLTVSGSNFTNNNWNAISNYFGNLTVNGCIFRNNSMNGYGGAIYNSGNLSVTGSTFMGNIANYGGAISNSGILTATGSTFVNNIANVHGGAIYNNKGNFTVTFSRIVGNAQQDIYNDVGAANVNYNWWGSNSNLFGKIAGTTVSNWLVLTIKSSLTSVGNYKKQIITVDLCHDNTGVYHNPVNGHVPDGINVIFRTTLGSVSSPQYTVNGVVRPTLNSGSVSGVSKVSAVVDNQMVSTSVKMVDTTLPKIISTNPKKGAAGVSRTSNITLRFSEKIKASSYWSKIVVKNKWGRTVKISKSISGNKLYIKTSKRSSYSYYTVYIPKYAVKDYAGHNLAVGYTFKFKTGKY